MPSHPLPWPALLGAALALTLSLMASFASAEGRSSERPIPSPVKPVMVPKNAPYIPPPTRTVEEFPALRAIERDSFYDGENPDLPSLQKMEEVTKGMPYDANGFPDWMRALREGYINPRESLKGDGKMEVLDSDIIMRNTKEMPNVRFPHRSHTLWLACSNCHPDPFKPVAGSNEIRMADIFRGNFCGKCHDRVAFITFFSCSRCHSVPQGTVAGR